MAFLLKSVWLGLFLAFIAAFIALGTIGIPAKIVSVSKIIPSEKFPQ